MREIHESEKENLKQKYFSANLFNNLAIVNSLGKETNIHPISEEEDESSSSSSWASEPMSEQEDQTRQLDLTNVENQTSVPDATIEEQKVAMS